MKVCDELINTTRTHQPPEHRSLQWVEVTVGAPRSEEYKVLGLPRNPESDELIFDVCKLALVLNPTKRNLVSLTGKFYDGIYLQL